MDQIEFTPLGKEGNEEILELVNDILENWNPQQVNNDVHYFAEMLCVVITGDITEKLLKKQPPKVSTNRWINTASNIIRFYIQEKRPWFELKRLIEISTKLYGIMCFLIRIHWQCTDGSKLYFESLNRAKEVLTSDELEVFIKVFRDNSFWGHPEQVLLCSMTDPDKKIRLWAFKIIEKAHMSQIQLASDKRRNFSFRKFLMPNVVGYLNTNANDYTQLCGDFDKIDPKHFGVPPLLQKYIVNGSLDQLHDFALNGNMPLFDIPCHSQSVERLVYLTSMAALAVIGYPNRHAYLINKEKACKKLPISKGFATKSQYIKANKKP